MNALAALLFVALVCVAAGLPLGLFTRRTTPTDPGDRS